MHILRILGLLLPTKLHISIDSLEFEDIILFSGLSVCLSWLGKLLTHPELGRANSRFNCKFPCLGAIRYLEQCVAITAVRTLGPENSHGNNPNDSKRISHAFRKV